MIIDAILDRRDGSPYTMETAKYIYDEATLFKMNDLARAFDCGSNEDCQRELARYIDLNEYNPDLKKYIYSVDWVN